MITDRELEIAANLFRLGLGKRERSGPPAPAPANAREREIATAAFQWALKGAMETARASQTSTGVVADIILSDPNWKERLRAKIESGGY